MRICEVTPYSLAEVSGISTVILDLGRRFSAQGHSTVILAPGPHPELPVATPTVVISTGSSFRNLVFAIRATAAIWRRRGTWDILHVHQGHPATLGACLMARLLSRSTVATFHLRPPTSRGLRRLVQDVSTGLLLSVATKRTYVSEDTRRSLGADGDVIRNGVDFMQVRAHLGDRVILRRQLGLDGVVVAFAGRIARIKGFHDLLEAIRRARRAGCDLRLLATGRVVPTETQELDVIMRSPDLSPYIINLGDREDHLRLLAAADVFALPSYREGLPIALLEAMAAGLPVVASSVGGIPEVVHDGREGFLIRAGDVEALEDRLRILATDSELRRVMGRNAEVCAEQMRMELVVRQYLGIFESARVGPKASRGSP